MLRRRIYTQLSRAGRQSRKRKGTKPRGAPMFAHGVYVPIPKQMISLIALLVSGISLIFSIIGFRRSKIFQDYEYATRLQISDERLSFGTESAPDAPALTYSATIENRGMKPVKIKSVHLDYGDKLLLEKRMKRKVEGEIYLPAGQGHRLTVDIRWRDVDQMKKRFDIDEALFALRVSYYDLRGQVKEAHREYGGFDGPNKVVSVVHRGETLT